jgi:hypothetical protein
MKLGKLVRTCLKIPCNGMTLELRRKEATTLESTLPVEEYMMWVDQFLHMWHMR